MRNPFKAVKEKQKEKEMKLLEEQHLRIEKLKELEEKEVATKGVHIPHPVESLKNKKEIKRLKKEIEVFEKSQRDKKYNYIYIIALCVVLCFGILAVTLEHNKSVETVNYNDNSVVTDDKMSVAGAGEIETEPEYEFEYDMAICWQSLHNRTIQLLDFDNGKVTIIYEKGDSVFTGECKRLDNGVICIDIGNPHYYLVDGSGKWAHECDENGENAYYGVSYSVSDGIEYIDLLQERLRGI